MKESTHARIAMRVSWVSIVGNVLLSAFKLFAGVAAHSGAMLSDAVHSLSDVFSTFVVMIGVKLAAKASDHEHPYGHERMECVAAILLAFVLCLTGIGIGWGGAQKILSGWRGEHLAAPGGLALVAAAISIVTKEAMYQYTKRNAARIQSTALMADAWHHRSDALSSVGSFAGILGARLGFPILDPIASVAICLFIVKASVSIFLDAIGRMTDKSCSDHVEEALRAVIRSQPGVLGVDQLKTRLFGDRFYVDVEIEAASDMPLARAHAVAQRTHDAIEAAFPQVKHCMVHVNPAGCVEQEDTDEPSKQ